MSSPVESHDPSRLGEVVEASSAEFTIHCYQLHVGAPLGTLVRTDGPEILAVVRNVTTASIDPARRPVARGQDQPDSEAVYQSNPQLEKLLRTEVQAIIVGHRGDNGFHQYLPALPPRIHAFARACGADDLRNFTQRLEFLPLLLQGQPPLADEVTAAFLRQAAAAHSDSESFLIAAGQEVARLLGSDLRRLNSLLRRLRP